MTMKSVKSYLKIKKRNIYKLTKDKHFSLENILINGYFLIYKRFIPEKLKSWFYCMHAKMSFSQVIFLILWYINYVNNLIVYNNTKDSSNNIRRGGGGE